MAMKRGAPLPDFIINAPTVGIAEMLYVEAFYALGTCRSHVGMDAIPTAIPWVTIKEYSDMLGLQGEEAVRFTKIIFALDAWFLSRRHRGTASGKQQDENAKQVPPDRGG